MISDLLSNREFTRSSACDPTPTRPQRNPAIFWIDNLRDDSHFAILADALFAVSSFEAGYTLTEDGTAEEYRNLEATLSHLASENRNTRRVPSRAHSLCLTKSAGLAVVVNTGRGAAWAPEVIVGLR